MTAAAVAAATEAAGGLTVAVKVQPRARRPGVGGTAPGTDGPRLRVAVTEAAEGGRANEAACAALARALGVPPGAVTLRAGAASRQKLLHVAGDPADLAPRLDALR